MVKLDVTDRHKAVTWPPKGDREGTDAQAIRAITLAGNKRAEFEIRMRGRLKETDNSQFMGFS